MPIVGKPQFNSFGEFTGYRGSAKDIRHSRTEAAANDRRTQVDTLTGLANKTQIKRSFSHNFRVFRNTKKSCAVLMINLDRFKQVNETLGQAAGNELLKQVAIRLGRVADERISIARLSADEFLIVMPDVDDRAILGDMGQRIVQILSQPYTIDSNQANFGASVGIAVAAYDGVETDELINAAD